MKIDHIRIYRSGDGEGFDIILRVRGWIMKEGTYPTLQAALDTAWALDGRKQGQPVYVYEGDFAGMLADAIAPALANLGRAK